MRTLTRSLVILALLWLEVILFLKAQELQRAEIVEGTKVVIVFLGIIFLAIVIGTIIATAVIPSIGEAVGGFFFNPNQQIEKGPYADAMACVAQGDYETAVEEYKKVAGRNPEDTHAVSEIVHLYCEKLGNPDAAEQYLSETLQKEWPPEQGAFFASRLVDVYWNYKHDAVNARHLLTQIAETMPETKYAANALHRMHEIDRALADEEAGLRLHAKTEEQQGEAEV